MAFSFHSEKKGEPGYTIKLKEDTVSSSRSQLYSNIAIRSGAQEKRFSIVNIFISPKLATGFPKQMQCLLRDGEFYFMPLNIYNLKHPYMYIVYLWINVPLHHQDCELLKDRNHLSPALYKLQSGSNALSSTKPSVMPRPQQKILSLQNPTGSSISITFYLKIRAHSQPFKYFKPLRN